MVEHDDLNVENGGKVEIFPIQNQSDLMGSVTINQIGISSKIIKRIDGITATILGYDVIFPGYVWLQRFPCFMGQSYPSPASSGSTTSISNPKTCAKNRGLAKK